MPVLAYILTALGAYLLGSIPFGFLVAKARGIDIRSVGSGNIGATNAMRVLGKPAGIFVLLMDAIKGYAACVVIAPLVFNWIAPHFTWYRLENIAYLARFEIRLYVVAGVFAVLGHNFPCWLKFKGGKGIATTGGVYLALAPWAVLVALVVFILAVVLTKYVSVGSISAAVALPATVWVMSPHNLLLGIVTTALGVLAVYKHKSNIQRLMAGTENRLGRKPPTAGGAK
ncbi:MAG: glycerol-3-phosphate 1-O-acyltransferase PlsY [Verrucomicrobia bacterium]|nr:glycerol-3-phosphate 1-O-acyltransferase PlsY [Verrucomicrobiota bacterium]